jgi:hypothetical protein
MIAFRHADRRLPFLWEGAGQPAGRWNANGEGPVHYFADTPDGAWAEFLRHEDITEPEDLATITRALWAVELPDAGYSAPALPPAVLMGGAESHGPCRAEARRLAAAGAMGLRAPSAALREGRASGCRVDRGLTAGPPRDGKTIVIFGARPDLVGWRAALGKPHEELLSRVRRLSG